MKNLHTVFLFMTFTFSVNAQITFQKTFGGTNIDGGNSVLQTSDGGFIIAGLTKSFGAGDLDNYLLKTDANGNVQWKKTCGNSFYDYSNALAPAANGGYLATGITASYGNGVYLSSLKTDADGNTVYYKTIGAVDGYSAAYDVQQTSDGGYVFSGTTYGVDTISIDHVYVVKTNSNSDTLWTMMLENRENGMQMWQDVAYGIKETSDGGYIVAVSSGSYLTQMNNAMLVRLNSSGTPQWAKTYGGPADDVVRYVYQTPDGGFLAAGTTRSFGAGGADFYLVKTDASGTLQWSKTYGGTSDEGLLAFSETSDGGYIACGTTLSFGSGSEDVYLVKINSTGDTVWTKTYGGASYESGVAVQQTTDGGYIITGATQSFGQGYRDLYLIKTDANGNSGCNEGGSQTITGNPTSTEGSHTTVFKRGGAIALQTDATANAGGIPNTICSVTDVDDLSSEKTLVIFPNPGKGIFNINCDEPILEITIFNLLGEKVMEFQVENNAAKINLSQHQNGMYSAIIKTKDNYFTQKIMVE